MINSFRIDYHFNTRWSAIHKQIKISCSHQAALCNDDHTWKNQQLPNRWYDKASWQYTVSFPAIRTLKTTSWCIIRKYIWLLMTIDICSFCICAVSPQSSIRNQRLLYNKASDQGCYFFRLPLRTERNEVQKDCTKSPFDKTQCIVEIEHAMNWMNHWWVTVCGHKNTSIYFFVWSARCINGSSWQIFFSEFRCCILLFGKRVAASRETDGVSSSLFILLLHLGWKAWMHGL